MLVVRRRLLCRRVLYKPLGCQEFFARTVSVPFTDQSSGADSACLQYFKLFFPVPTCTCVLRFC